MTEATGAAAAARERLGAGERDTILADLGKLLEALGLGDGARPESPHEVMLGCIAEVQRLRAAAREHAIDLAAIARSIQAALRENRANGLTDGNALDVTALTVAEEAGEVIGAYRRWSGHARRTATLADLGGEVADLLIVTAIFAELAGIDINAAVRDKTEVIFSRGWTEPREVPGA